MSRLQRFRPARLRLFDARLSRLPASERLAVRSKDNRAGARDSKIRNGQPEEPTLGVVFRGERDVGDVGVLTRAVVAGAVIDSVPRLNRPAACPSPGNAKNAIETRIFSRFLIFVLGRESGSSTFLPHLLKVSNA